ncbi:MAG: biotin--[acetyl-CoA-carboxylase] ligase [Rikenellaceae bacterium]
MIYHFKEVSSTNDTAKDSCYEHGDIICAERQSRGRGQRGHQWISQQGVNLTFTLVLHPTNLLVKDQFMLSEVVALALVDLMSSYDITAKIKWTNDIYVNDRKVVGVLIENKISGRNLSCSWVGIGINVNQRVFDPSIPNPTSMFIESRAEELLERERVLEDFNTIFHKWYAYLERGEYEFIRDSYVKSMYRLEEWHKFSIKEGGEVVAKIEGVHTQGELELRYEDNTLHRYLFGEVAFLIEGRDLAKKE